MRTINKTVTDRRREGNAHGVPVTPRSAIARSFTEGGVGPSATPHRPTLDDTIRLRESHLSQGASRSVEIQAAIRLEEIYRTVKQDPAWARGMVRRVSARYPDGRNWNGSRKGG